MGIVMNSRPLNVIFYENIERITKIYETAKRNTLFIFIFTIILLILLSGILQIVPQWQVAKFRIDNSTTVAQLENSYRATLAQIIGGFGLLLGLYFTWSNTVTAKESQITNHFTQAIGQLGSKDLEIKLGGIYGLERIATKSMKDTWLIMDIFTTYVRKNASIIDEFEKLSQKIVDNEMEIEDFSPHKMEPVGLDIQAILSVIGRRKYSAFNTEPFDMSETNLKGVNLFRANFEWIQFNKCNFNDNFLALANFRRCGLFKAFLEGADLEWADLKGSDIRNANFKGANLRGVNFEGALLNGANFEGADLTGARNLSLDQLSTVETLSNAKLDKRILNAMKEKKPTLFSDISR